MGVFMRVATVLLGFVLAMIGGASEASDSSVNGLKGTSSASLTDGLFAAPSREGFANSRAGNWTYGAEGHLRAGAIGVMGLVPSQEPGAFLRARLPLAESTVKSARRYNPATTPLPKTRTLEDHLLTGFVALMLIAYQLRRKHRFLRPHQFST
jgi:hypothetical protein